MNISQIGLQGLNQAQNDFDQAATNAIKASLSSSSQSNDSVDLSSAAVSLLSAKNGVSFNLAFIKEADKLEKQAINLIG